MKKITQGDVPIDGIFWVDGIRYKRIGVTTIIPISMTGFQTTEALTVFPFDEIDRIEDGLLPNGYEQQRAEFEAKRNECADTYFGARPHLDRIAYAEQLFEGGFRMAWEIAKKWRVE